MRKYKFIEQIPSVGYPFEVGDEINVRKTLADGKYRWEQYKIAADSLIYPASIQKEEWEKLDELTPEVLEKLVESYTNSEIDQMIRDGVIGATSGLIIVKGTALPTPTADVAFAIVGQGVYTRAGQPNVVVPANNIGILLWEKPTWSLGATQEVPNNVDQKINEQKGIPGGIVPLDSNAKIAKEFVDAYTKAETNTKDATFVNELSKKVDKVAGKGLSTNDYLTEDKTKVGKLIVSGDGKMVLTNSGEYVKLSGGSGSGFYNVTTKLPLPNNEFYTLQTAVNAVSTQDIDDQDKIGMIITFETSLGNWEDYRFVGAESQFEDFSYWQEYTIKDIIRGIVLNGEELIKDSADKVYIDVDTTVDQTIDPNSTNAVSSAAVAAEFASLSSKYVVALQLNESGEGDDKVYSISGLDEEGNILTTTAEFSGGGGGSGPVATTKIVLTKNTVNPTVKEGDDVRLEFYYDHRDTATDSSTGLTAKALITIVSGATSTTTERTLSADTNTVLNVTDQLLVGSNTVRVRVEVDNGETLQVSTISWRVQVVTLRLTSAFDFATLTTRGQNITLPYNLTGSGSKTLRLYLNGAQIEDKVITTSSSNGSFTINTAGLGHGSHSLQMVALLEVSSSVTLLSNSIYFDVAIRESNRTESIIATRFDYTDGTIIGRNDFPKVKTKQFGEYKINYAGYNPLAGQDVITVSVANVIIASVTTAFTQRSVSNRATQSGLYPGIIKIGNTNYPFNVDVEQSDVNLVEPTDNLVFKLTALGRSNSDSNRDKWTYGNITTSFTGVQWAGDGWINNGLRLMNGGKATINHKPLDLSNASSRLNAFALTTKFKVSSVSNTQTPLISCMSNGVGFQITSEEAKMVTSGNSEVVMKFASGREYNIAFVSMPLAEPVISSEYEIANSQMLYLYIDGILSGGVQRGSGDNIYQQGVTTNIILQGTGSTLDVYNMRLYNSYLTSEQVLTIATIDLNTVEEILAKYEFNNVVDAEGDVTVESLPNGMRYAIVTGQQANGMNTVQYAAAINNKDIRYDVDEILHIIKGGDPKLNWKCVGGSIRLQGTSSLAYPIKNYRFYFRSAASSAIFGQVYLGVDGQGNGGELITAAKPKVSFKTANAKGKLPAPVNVWCLKADFAESSSSHNTGMAKMTNDVYIASGNPTPAQKYVVPSYKYDVRTAIDGEPCYLFYRNTISDKPKFVGKYNFNNDKSTEEVFGFLDIPGYHLTSDGSAPSAWVTEKFAGVNPTECWEFLNNDYPMGSYLDDDFDTKDESGKPEWTKVFEARFPDKQKDYETGVLPKPKYLSDFVTWVKSTQNDRTKFRNELANYADVKHLCTYFILTQWMGAVDQMVKNAMLGFWYNPAVDKMLAYYIFYDGDTIFGVRNDGRLKYSWDIDRQTLDPELTASAGKNIYAFMGHDSVLWNNLESMFQPELEQAYKDMRREMTNDYIFNIYDRDQSGKFAERIYNLDAQYKYIEPKTLGIDVIINGVITNTKYSYLEAMQGSRQSHRRWWLENRLDLFDARYATGQYTLTDITWKGISDVGAKVSATMSRDYYVEFRRESTTMDRKFVPNNGAYSYTYGQTANVGTIFHLLGGKYFKTLNMSDWGGFTDLTLPVLLNLEQLVLGKAGRTYTLSELIIGAKMPMLKTIDITNYTVIPSLDLSGCTKMEVVYARGCTNLGTINFANGSPINELILPTGLNTLRLVGLPYLNNTNIKFPDGNNVKNLIVDSSPLIGWETLFTTLGKVENIRITGIDRSGSINTLDKYKNLGGIDVNGNVVPNARLVGKFQSLTYLDEATYADYRTSFPELNILQPEYSVLRIYEKDPTSKQEVMATANLYNDDNKTGYSTNKVYVPSGHLKKILDNRHRYLGKQGAAGVMTICQLHDKNSNVYNDNVNPLLATEALLEGQQGDVWVKENRYWYKGVTDVLNGVTHVAISSNDTMPSKPDPSLYKKITKAEMVSGSMITSGRYVSRGYPNINDALLQDTNYAVIKIDVAGYTRIKFTMSQNIDATGTLCSAFVNLSGNVIEEHRTQQDTYVISTDYIANIPSAAKFLYVTVHTDYLNMDGMYFVMSKSTDIFTLEPDWVERDPQLVAVFESSFINNRFRSVRTLNRPTSMTKESAVQFLNARRMISMGYDDSKDIRNLMYFKYGNRDIDRVCGFTSYFSASGNSTEYGMLDTSVDGFTFESKFRVTDNVGTTVYVNKNINSILGYESFSIGDLRSIPVTDPNASMLFNFGGPNQNYLKMNQRKDKHKRNTIVLANQAQSLWVRHVLWSKFLDLFPRGTQGGNDAMYYADAFYGGLVAGTFSIRTPAGNFDHGLFHHRIEGSTPSSDGRLFRMAYEGAIVETKNVTEFKQIVEAV